MRDHSREPIADPSIDVVYPDPGGEGYLCIFHMARLAAKLLNGELITIRPENPTLTDKLNGIFLPRKRSHRACLLICPSPVDLGRMVLIRNWRKTYSRIVAWVYDSFWTKWVPPWVRLSRVFDQVFVTEREDLNSWRRILRAPVDWLPWGSDVLNFGSSKPVRRLDLVRFGRQPKEWDDDITNARACESLGLTFHGRPPSFSDATENERGIMGMLSSTKFALAFSNRANPTMQTHPEREYITGRWTDALASGATVAGIPPRSETVQSLLWPEALLDIGTTDQAEGLNVIASAVREWTPERAHLNYIRSIEGLDWRWRFKTLADALGIRSSDLDAELARLRAIIRAAHPTATIR
jgi:hypothetical protein